MHKVGRTVMQAGLVIMGLGLLALYAAVQHAGTAVGSVDFVAPLLVSGVGMGMVWVPMFEIIVGDVADHEVGSASGVLQAVQQLGMSLGVAGIGTIFFGALGTYADHTRDFLEAAQQTTLITAVLVALAAALGFLLPKRARSGGGEWAAAEPEPALA
jgi:hypothetical protein